MSSPSPGAGQRARENTAVSKREQWPTTLDWLRTLHRLGVLSVGHVDAAAEALRVSRRTVYRRLAAPEPTARDRFAASGADLAAYVDFRGNIAAVHRARTAAQQGRTTAAGVPIDPDLARAWAGEPQVTERTLRRAFADALLPAEVAALHDGERAARGKRVYLTSEVRFRNVQWQGDHKQLPLICAGWRGATCSPWCTVFQDAASRMIVGWAVADHPNSAHVLTALHMGLAAEAPGGAGGVPAGLLVDRGLDFAAKDVRNAMGALCVQIARTPPHTPHLKGKIERLFETVDTTFLTQLPGFRNGPRNAAGKLYGPVDDRIDRSKEPHPILAITLKQLVVRFAAWVAWYNTENIHGQLGCTPLEAWLADPTPVYRIPPEKLRHLLLASEERVIQKKGVRHDSQYFVGPSIQGRGGQRVTVRYMPHDDRFIELYQGETYLGQVHPVDKQTPQQKEEFRAATRAQGRRMGKLRSAATRRARARLAPMTDAAPEPTDTVLVHPAALAEARASDRQAALDKRASDSLLGLRPVRARDPSRGESDPAQPSMPDTPGQPAGSDGEP